LIAQLNLETGAYLREATSHPLSPSPPLNASQICAVVITFNPDDTLEHNLRALQPEVNKIIIVDNRSRDELRSRIAMIASATASDVIWNAQNQGIASALNVGIQHALSQSNYQWIATFDQDSRVLPGFTKAMLEAHRACHFRDEVGVIGPRYVANVADISRPIRHGEREIVFRELATTMTSGNLLDPKIFAIAGMFDDSFFIDYVDHEFCLRLRRHGFRIIEAENANIIHRLGSPTKYRFLMRTVVASNHSPFRRYHNTRNRFRVYGRYFATEPAWILSDFYGWCKELAKLVLFEKDRKSKLAGMAKGAWDAVRGSPGSEIPSNARFHS